jgi:GAF domain-containing protein
LIDDKGNCWGTLQSLNKKKGDFSNEDLDLLNMTAHMLAIAIHKNRRHEEMVLSNIAYRNLENRLSTKLAISK